MANTFTSLALVCLTLLALVAWALSLRRLRRGDAEPVSDTAQHALVALIGVSAAGLFLWRWLAVHGKWQPLAAHVDGLLLIATLFAATVLFIQRRPRLFGLSAFALPLLALILAWGICAAAWTYHPFNLQSLHPVWTTVHLAGVYLGTLGAAVAAIGGGMYLYVQSRLKHKQGLASFGHLASLEALESLIIRTATLGFALLTLGLASGLVILSHERGVLGAGWWYGPKIVLAVLAWAVYALVMNVRHATRFRGARAAWLAIGGLVLLLATYAVVNAWPHAAANDAAPPPAVPVVEAS